jgi:hypothetical protein
VWNDEGAIRIIREMRYTRGDALLVFFKFFKLVPISLVIFSFSPHFLHAGIMQIIRETAAPICLVLWVWYRATWTGKGKPGPHHAWRHKIGRGFNQGCQERSFHPCRLLTSHFGSQNLVMFTLASLATLHVFVREAVEVTVKLVVYGFLQRVSEFRWFAECFLTLHY